MPRYTSAAIVIPTLDRLPELRNAIRSCLEQEGEHEVIIICDGSPKEVPETIRKEFPEVHVLAYDETGGCGLRRNDGVEASTKEVVFSIDDDAVFSAPDTVQRILDCFDDDRIGAVAIPFMNVKQGDEIYQQPPDDRTTYITERYRGTAFAIRKDVFRQVGGFCPVISHQGEEGDYCIRMLEAGYLVRLGRCEPIHHFESVRRDFTYMDRNGRRNDVLFVWKNVPMPFFFWHMPAIIYHGLRHGLRVGRLGNMFTGLMQGLKLCLSPRIRRKPVRAGTYRTSRFLRTTTSIPLSQVQEIMHEH